MFTTEEVKSLKPTERAQLVSVVNAVNSGKHIMIECNYKKVTDTISREQTDIVLATKGKHAGLVQSVWKSKEGNWCLTIRDVARNDFTTMRLEGIKSFRKIGEINNT